MKKCSLMITLWMMVLLLTLTMVSALATKIVYERGNWRMKDDAGTEIPINNPAAQTAFNQQMNSISSSRHGYVFVLDTANTRWSAQTRSGSAVPLSALGVDQSYLDNTVSDAVSTAAPSAPGALPPTLPGGAPAAQSSVPTEGYPDADACLNAGFGPCKQLANGRYAPLTQPALGSRPGEDPGAATACTGNCFYYNDPQTGETLVTRNAADCGSQGCIQENSYAQWQDAEGKQHFIPTINAPCEGVATVGDQKCYTVPGTTDRSYICGGPNNPSCPSEGTQAQSANARTVASKRQYWTPPSADECTNKGGRMIEGTGVCEVIGDCPASWYQPSCSKNLEEEKAYATYIVSLLNQARLSSLLEAGAAGRAWGQVFSFMTFGAIPADKPLWEEFWETDAGMVITGNWETSICRITPDVSDTIGIVMNAEGSGIGMWVKGEFSQVRGRPEETAPEQTYDLYIYKLTTSVMPSGLTAHSGEEGCADKVRFYIRLQGGGAESEDVDFGQQGDPSDNIVELQCNGPPATYSGSSAIIWPSRNKFEKVCLEFEGTDFHPQIADEVGNELCADLVESGSPEDLGCSIDVGSVFNPTFECPTATGERPAGYETAPSAPEGEGSFGAVG
ncbi:hypothetical protein HY488_00755 [Candidatus Woesearchaeota archaeon]|nr:hypothetical protein [Candidatus Woesearchaeota archaeon]